MFQRHQYVVHGVSVCILDTRQPRCLGRATALKDADRNRVLKTFGGLSCCIEKVNLYFRCSTNLKWLNSLALDGEQWWSIFPLLWVLGISDPMVSLYWDLVEVYIETLHNILNGVCFEHSCVSVVFFSLGFASFTLESVLGVTNVLMFARSKFEDVWSGYYNTNTVSHTVKELTHCHVVIPVSINIFTKA